MKLLLLESVYGLGRPGDQVTVKPGYARNYLIPQRLATRVTNDSLRMLARLKQKADEEERAAISSAQDLASKIAGFAVAIQGRATEDGHLFGSVTEKDVHHALVLAGWDVPLRAVRMVHPIKEAGVTEVELHFYAEIGATVSVDVQPIDSDGNLVVPEEKLETPDEEAEGESSEGAEVGTTTPA